MLQVHAIAAIAANISQAMCVLSCCCYASCIAASSFLLEAFTETTQHSTLQFFGFSNTSASAVPGLCLFGTDRLLAASKDIHIHRDSSDYNLSPIIPPKENGTFPRNAPPNTQWWCWSSFTVGNNKEVQSSVPIVCFLT